MKSNSIWTPPALALLLALLAPGIGHGHGAGYQRVTEDSAVSLVFHYAGGQPMAYAAVRVFGPDDSAVEFQNGRTDRRGGFSFRPDQPGEWRAEVRDGRGHAVTATIPVDDATAAPPAANPPTGKSATPGWRDVLLGLSLIANLGLGFWALRKRTPETEARGEAAAKPR